MDFSHLGQNTAILEEKVDNMVYDLYGLSEEEKKQVNKFVNEQRNV